MVSLRGGSKSKIALLLLIPHTFVTASVQYQLVIKTIVTPLSAFIMSIMDTILIQCHTSQQQWWWNIKNLGGGGGGVGPVHVQH